MVPWPHNQIKRIPSSRYRDTEKGCTLGWPLFIFFVSNFALCIFLMYFTFSPNRPFRPRQNIFLALDGLSRHPKNIYGLRNPSSPSPPRYHRSRALSASIRSPSIRPGFFVSHPISFFRSTHRFYKPLIFPGFPRPSENHEKLSASLGPFKPPKSRFRSRDRGRRGILLWP